MADFLLCRGAAAPALAKRTQDRLARAGLSFVSLLEEEGLSVLWRNGGQAGQDSFWRQDNDNWILCAGLFAHQGKAGARALQRFFDGFDPQAPNLRDTLGQFALVIRKAGRLHLLCDALSTNKIYHDRDQSLFSNLFVAAAEGLENPSLDHQGCYEYVWNGVPGGELTFFRELLTLPAGRMAVIEGGRVTQAALPPPALAEDEAEQSMARTATRQCERLRAVMEAYRRAFGEQVNLLFSGGYDSRLLLALLLDVGLRPRLTVYGPPGDLDREIAGQVAEGEGLDFNPVDKSLAETPAAEDFAKTLLADYAAFDGWRVTGLIDSGVDRRDRIAQTAGGWAKMNGSLGEIYRNFFYLPDRPFTARQVVQAFYARYDPRTMTDRFDAEAYEETMAQAILSALDSDEALLSRRQVELVYPLFRGRYWTAREVPLNQAFGGYLTPFMEPAVIRGTPDWKIAWKSHGRIEAEMITQLSPRLAAYPSVYGRPLDQAPSWKARLRAAASYHRPILLRRLSFRLQQGKPGPMPDFLSPDHLAAVMEPGFPYMRALFKPERVADEDVFNRILTLEFLAQRYQARGE